MNDLCGSGENACPPQCCKGVMSKEEAKADAEASIRAVGERLVAAVQDERSREQIIRELAAEPGGLARMAEAWGIPMSILLQAEKITNGQRQKDYGTALDNHERIARLWSAFLANDPDQRFGLSPTFLPEDVAEMMILMKVARIQNEVTEDGLVDIAGYANVIAKMGPQRAERAARMVDGQ